MTIAAFEVFFLRNLQMSVEISLPVAIVLHQGVHYSFEKSSAVISG
jgi:hypothetical protein